MRRLLANESGFTLVELLVTMSIMLVVLVGISEGFASGARSQTNVAERQQAESDARTALTKMRDDIHCSTGLNSVTANADSNGNLTGGFTLELAETNVCAAVNTTGGGSKVALRWCTVPSTLQPNAFALYRTTQTCDGTTGVKMVDNIVIPNGGSWQPNTLAGSLTNWAGNIWPTPPSCTAAGYLPTVKVDLSININYPHSPSATYELQDQIAIRNAVRCAGGSPGAGGSANPTLTVSPPSGGTSGVSISGSKISAIVAASNNESAPITYTYFGPQASPPTNCTTGGTVLGTATTAGNGSYASSGSISNPSVGYYWWYASMPTDGTNAATTSACGAGMPSTQVLSTKWSPTLAVTSPDTAAAGSAINPSSILGTISGSSGQTSGALTFKYWLQASAPSTCTGGTVLGTASPTGDGLWSPSAGIASASAGTYWWYASFAGDATDNGAASTCGASMASTVVKATPTLALTAPASGTAGTAITAASVTGTLAGGSSPTGTLTFTVFGPQASAPTDCTTGGTTVGTAAVSGAGTYHPSAAYTPSSAGTYWWYASYGGDTSNNTATSTCGSSMATTVVGSAPLLVTSISSTNVIAGTAGKLQIGDTFSVTFSAALNPATVNTAVNGSTITLCSHVSSCSSNGQTLITVSGLTSSGGFLVGSSYVGNNSQISATGTLSLSNGNKTVTFTVTGAPSGTAATGGAVTFSFQPLGTIKDTNGNAATTAYNQSTAITLF
jgi:prepilin-type N-terminal cleavage/methylation domain-containing protein